MAESLFEKKIFLSNHRQYVSSVLNGKKTSRVEILALTLKSFFCLVYFSFFLLFLLLCQPTEDWAVVDGIILDILLFLFQFFCRSLVFHSAGKE